MKKTATILITLVISISGFTQTLTNGQVFDFAIGDLIQGRYQITNFGSGGPPTYITQTIIGKSFSVNNDTIIYTIKTNRYTPASCPTCNPTYSSDTIMQVISDLDSSANHTNETTCLTTSDTMFFDYCNRQVWERYPNNDTGCFEPLTHTTQFVAGLGGPYFTKLDPSAGPTETKYELIYYQKTDTTCGTFITEVLENKKPDLKIEIFPNPTSNKLNIRSAQKFTYYDIMDLTGKVYASTRLLNDTIDISFLNKGTYFVNFYTAEFKTVTKKLQKD